MGKTFCARNNVGLIVRSHQCIHNGRGFDVLHAESLIRVFSARDYEDCYNDGAILDIRLLKDDKRFKEEKTKEEFIKAFYHPGFWTYNDALQQDAWSCCGNTVQDSCGCDYKDRLAIRAQVLAS